MVYAQELLPARVRVVPQAQECDAFLGSQSLPLVIPSGYLTSIFNNGSSIPEFVSNSSQNVPALKITSPPREVGLDRRAVRHLSGGLVRLGLIGAVRCVMFKASSPADCQRSSRGAPRIFGFPEDDRLSCHATIFSPACSRIHSRNPQPIHAAGKAKEHRRVEIRRLEQHSC